MEQRLGLVALCKVKHVYAADRLSVMLINSAGHQMRDDLTVQLPVDANTIMRPGDPPLIVLKLFDPEAKDGHTSLAPGPCPEAANFTRRLIRRAAATMVHIPIPERSTWLDGLKPGSIELGDLLLLDRHPDPERIALAMSGKWLSSLLVASQHAQERPSDAA